MQSPNGYQIFRHAWKVENAQAKIIIVHGIAEHLGRYQHVADYFNQQNIDVYSFDFPGHGKSEGPRCNLNRYHDYLKVLEQNVEKVLEEDNLACFVLGHSMGGGLIFKLAIQNKYNIRGWIMTAALLKVNEDISPLLQKMSGFISGFAPNLKTVKLEKKHISRDPKVVDAYINDPLVYNGGVKARIGAELIKMSKEIQSEMESFRAPILILHGGDDQLTKTDESILLNEKASSLDKTLKIYPKLYHEILNEPEQAQVMDDMMEWIKERM